MIEIECEEPTFMKCECCGEQSTQLTRFVYQDGDAYAVYYAALQHGEPEPLVKMAVSLGDWGENAQPSERLAFALRLWAVGERAQVSITDAAESPWKDVALLGRFLDRSEALAHPWVKEVFHITDHVVVQDAVVRSYLGQGAA